MADTKISGMTSAGSVAGSDVIPIVQSSTNKKATADQVVGMTTLGDTLYGGASGTRTRLAGNTTTITKYLAQTGNGSASAAPSWVALPAAISVACSDESTALTTGTAKVTFHAPFAMTVTEVIGEVNTVPTGSTLQFDVNINGTTMFSTNPTIDASEETTLTAATAAVISTSSIAKGDKITIDIDQIGSTIAGKGLKVHICGTRA